MRPYYEDGAVTIYHGDCREVVPSVTADVVLTDPPYGIGYDPATSTQQGIQRFAGIRGDREPFDPSRWLGFRDVILWGCNYYCNRVPPYEGAWYFWDKVIQNGTGVRIGEAEYAWHKLGTKPRGFRHLWSGAYRASESGQRAQHPTQKPVELMQWCLSQMADGVVVDPYMGSGSTLVAAKQMGRRAVGVEIEERYCEVAAKRLSQEVLDLGAA